MCVLATYLAYKLVAHINYAIKMPPRRLTHTMNACKRCLKNITKKEEERRREKKIENSMQKLPKQFANLILVTSAPLCHQELEMKTELTAC